MSEKQWKQNRDDDSLSSTLKDITLRGDHQ